MKIAVFCGSRAGKDPDFAEAAKRLGRLIGARGWTLVYGGAEEGLMGTVATAVAEAGGSVIGILTEMPEIIETRHPLLTVCETVKDLDARKARMMELADACIALPGGPGTLEELSEAISLARLRVSSRRVLYLNEKHYYEPLTALLEGMVKAGFIAAEDLALVTSADSPEEAVAILEKTR